VLDYQVRPGVTSDEGDGDEWPRLPERILGAEILVVASPTWLGRPSSVAQCVLARIDAMIAEDGRGGRPVTTASPASSPTTSSTGWAWPPRTAPWPAPDSGRRQPPGATGWPIPIMFPSLSRNHAARSPAPPLLG
jgi:hypothetical protein